jgi:hypothetical protein
MQYSVRELAGIDISPINEKPLEEVPEMIANHRPLKGITLTLPTTAQRSRSKAEWDGKCKDTETQSRKEFILLSPQSIVRDPSSEN